MSFRPRSDRRAIAAGGAKDRARRPAGVPGGRSSSRARRRTRGAQATPHPTTRRRGSSAMPRLVLGSLTTTSWMLWTAAAPAGCSPASPWSTQAPPPSVRPSLPEPDPHTLQRCTIGDCGRPGCAPAWRAPPRGACAQRGRPWVGDCPRVPIVVGAEQTVSHRTSMRGDQTLPPGDGLPGAARAAAAHRPLVPAHPRTGARARMHTGPALPRVAAAGWSRKQRDYLQARWGGDATGPRPRALRA